MLSYRANGIRGYTNDVRLRGLEEVTGRMEFAAIQTMSASADWKLGCTGKVNAIDHAFKESPYFWFCRSTNSSILEN